MGLLKNPIGGIDIHLDIVIHTSKNLDYIIKSDNESILCLGSKVTDLTEMICRDLTSNVSAHKGKYIKEHKYLSSLCTTHNLEDDVIYYLLGYKDSEDPNNLICFVFDDVMDCISLQSCLSSLSLSMKTTFLEGQND